MKRVPAFLAILLLAPTLRADSWRAEWIGPAAPPKIDLEGAAWVWTAEAGVDATMNAPAGERRFQRVFVVPGDRPVRAATALFAADDRCRIAVNGVDAGGSDDWRQAAALDVTALVHPGTNRIEIWCANGEPSGSVNAAGLIGRLRVTYGEGEAMEIATDAGWQGAAAAATSPWAPVQVLGAYAREPWGRGVAGGASAPANLWTCYRKGFTMAERPTSAVARIAVDSKYWLWVNGRLVVREGGLKRGPNPQDTYFDAVDLAPHLQQGDNTIAVLAWYWGKDGFSHKSSGQAGLLFELEAGANRVLSDSTWRMLRHPAFGEASRKPNFRLAESSVYFDARRDQPGWTEPAFDDRAWAFARAFGCPPVGPWHRLWPREIPQWKDGGLRAYENAGAWPDVSDGRPISAALPYNAQVTPWLKVVAPAGQFIRVGTDNPANEVVAEYVTREGEQEFETPAWMNGHRVVYEIPAGIRILGLQYRETGFDTEFVGRFNCDDAFLESLWTKCARTLYVNMRDNFFDCPDRERAQWWGDLVIQLGQVFYTFDARAHALVRKGMYNLCQWQRPSKTLFSPIPAGNWDKELPQQMLASVGVYGFWTYYLNTGDRRTLADVYPHVRDYLSIWQTDADGLVVHRSGENGWDWADWGENVDIRVLDQAWFCLALEGAARMADELEQPGEAAAYRRRREAVIAAANRIFWTGSAYRDPAYRGATDDRAQGLAVVSGLAGPDRYAAIKAVLAQEFHASPYLEKYILESLFLMGDPAAAQARLRKRYQEMVDSETSTLWELFGRGGTLNHAWTGGPLTLMFQYMAGIAPTSPGFATYEVRPQMGALTHIRAVVPTVRGRLAVELRREPDRFTAKLDSPAGTKARVHLPARTPARVNGRPVADHEGIVEVGPGTWEIVQ